jgi:hypothetical protein
MQAPNPPLRVKPRKAPHFAEEAKTRAAAGLSFPAAAGSLGHVAVTTAAVGFGLAGAHGHDVQETETQITFVWKEAVSPAGQPTVTCQVPMLSKKLCAVKQRGLLTLAPPPVARCPGPQ